GKEGGGSKEVKLVLECRYKRTQLDQPPQVDLTVTGRMEIGLDPAEVDAKLIFPAVVAQQRQRPIIKLDYKALPVPFPLAVGTPDEWPQMLVRHTALGAHVVAIEDRRHWRAGRQPIDKARQRLGLGRLELT